MYRYYSCIGLGLIEIMANSCWNWCNEMCGDCGALLRMAAIPKNQQETKRLDVLLTLTQNLPYTLNRGLRPRTLRQSSFRLFAGREVFRSSLTDLRIAGRYSFFICISAQIHVHTKFKTCHLNFRAEMLNRVYPTNPCERGKTAARTTMNRRRRRWWLHIFMTFTILAHFWLLVLRLMLCSWCLDYFPFVNHGFASPRPMHE